MGSALLAALLSTAVLGLAVPLSQAEDMSERLDGCLSTLDSPSEDVPSMPPSDELPPLNQMPSDELPWPDQQPPSDELPLSDELPPSDELPLPDQLPPSDELPVPDQLPPSDELPVPGELPSDALPLPTEAEVAAKAWLFVAHAQE